MIQIIFAACGGFFGSIARFSISLVCKKHPIGTWIANVSGSLLLAIFFRLYMEQSLNEYLWLLFGTGFCGAFTTFSTFGNEVLEMLQTEKYIHAFIYIIGTLFISLCAIIIVFSI